MADIHRLIGMGSDLLVEELLGHPDDKAADGHSRHFEDLMPEIRAFPGPATCSARSTAGAPPWPWPRRPTRSSSTPCSRPSPPPTAPSTTSSAPTTSSRASPRPTCSRPPSTPPASTRPTPWWWATPSGTSRPPAKLGLKVVGGAHRRDQPRRAGGGGRHRRLRRRRPPPGRARRVPHRPPASGPDHDVDHLQVLTRRPRTTVIPRRRARTTDGITCSSLKRYPVRPPPVPRPAATPGHHPGAWRGPGGGVGRNRLQDVRQQGGSAQGGRRCVGCGPTIEPVPMAERDFVRRIQRGARPRPQAAGLVERPHRSSTSTVAPSPSSSWCGTLCRQRPAAGRRSGLAQMVTEKLTGMAMFAAHLDEGADLRPGPSSRPMPATC